MNCVFLSRDSPVVFLFRLLLWSLYFFNQRRYISLALSVFVSFSTSTVFAGVRGDVAHFTLGQRKRRMRASHSDPAIHDTYVERSGEGDAKEGETDSALSRQDC